MTYNTAIRRSVLSSLKLKKTIISETVSSQVIINGVIQNRARTSYKAYVDDADGEFKDIVIRGYSETDVFKKLNNRIVDLYKNNHPSEYATICKTAKMDVED